MKEGVGLNESELEIDWFDDASVATLIALLATATVRTRRHFADLSAIETPLKAAIRGHR
jgi:hypothetical protein